MKNFSTGAARSLAARTTVAMAAAWLSAGFAQAATDCKFRPNAPDKHVVVRHDTLWGISGTFLEHAWCWPQVWGMNKEEIHNPHWIYPGQTVYFDREHGRLTLNRPNGQGVGNGNGNAGDNGPLKLSPQVRTESMGLGGAIQSVSRQVIDGLISKSLVVETEELDASPRIVAAADGSRIYIGKGDRIYVRGNLGATTEFQVFHPGTPLTDPDTHKIMGYETTNVGAARVVAMARAGVDVSTLEVTSSSSEMGVGDRLRPATPLQELNYVPHAPQQNVAARVMSIATEANEATQSQIVTVNRGALDGLDIGSVLVLYHPGKTMVDPADKHNFDAEPLRLPDEKVGDLFIFRVFGHVAYGVIMESKMPIEIGDRANSPE
jgi:hypothetical protein